MVSIDSLAAIRIRESMRVLLVGLLALGCAAADNGGSDEKDAGPDAPNAAEVGATGGWFGDECEPDAGTFYTCGPMVYDQCFPLTAEAGSCSPACNGTCTVRCSDAGGMCTALGGTCVDGFCSKP